MIQINKKYKVLTDVYQLELNDLILGVFGDDILKEETLSTLTHYTPVGEAIDSLLNFLEDKETQIFSEGDIIIFTYVQQAEDSKIDYAEITNITTGEQLDITNLDPERFKLIEKDKNENREKQKIQSN